MDDNGAVSTYTAIVRVMNSLQPLSVNLELNNLTVVEMEKVNVTVYVTDGPTPVANAKVKLFAIGGVEFVASTGQTDESGYFNTMFTAPDIGAVEKGYVRIVATASKNGAVYSDGSDHEYLEVLQTEVTEPENLTVEIIPESTQTFSGAQAGTKIKFDSISVNATSDEVTIYVRNWGTEPAVVDKVYIQGEDVTDAVTTTLPQTIPVDDVILIKVDGTKISLDFTESTWYTIKVAGPATYWQEQVRATA